MIFKNKVKKRDFKLKLTNDELIIFVNLIINTVSAYQNDIQKTKDTSKLVNLINKRNTLMNISNQLGFNIYQKENIDDVKKEIDLLLNNPSNNNLENQIEEREEKKILSDSVGLNSPVDIE